ncbi:MAG: ATP-dependent DNA ligase [Gemmataceae bacterium]
MKAFADLYAALDETTKTNEKVKALVRYFRSAPPADAAWAIYFLSGRKPKQVVPTRKLAEWAIEMAGVPEWLFEESYHAVGDLAETIALLLPQSGSASDLPLHVWVEQKLLPLRTTDEAGQLAGIREAWLNMDDRQRFVWNKLITGAFRVGVSQQLVTRALAQVSGVDASIIAHRMMGSWEATPEFFNRLIGPQTSETDISRPYPFFLAFPIEEDPATLGDRADWQIEWKWDGIRAQLIRRAGQTFLWSRGEELVTERYPEIAEAADSLPDGTVLDGELLPWSNGQVMPFAQLQRRIGRKTLGKKILSDVPVVLVAYDLLEDHGVDIRQRQMKDRRARLEEILHNSGSSRLLLSPLVEGTTWEDLSAARAKSRTRFVEGLMLKGLTSPYRVGRQRGDWWKWKINPFTVDAVLIYAQRGSGKRASLYTDYTFGVWHEGQLVPVAKAYSGLTNEEIRQVDAFIRKNTVEKFGPVRSVKPELVFELAFEGIQASTRHKSGVAVRFPRIHRWRTDKPAAEADTLATLQALI